MIQANTVIGRREAGLNGIVRGSKARNARHWICHRVDRLHPSRPCWVLTSWVLTSPCQIDVTLQSVPCSGRVRPRPTSSHGPRLSWRALAERFSKRASASRVSSDFGRHRILAWIGRIDQRPIWLQACRVSHARRLDAVRGKDVKDILSSREQIVRNDAPVASPPHRFRAHDCATPRVSCLAQLG